MDTKALIKLWNVTQLHSGTAGAREASGVLLGLYNGMRFPYDLTGLRCMDQQYLDAALSVITSDATHCQKEVHEWLNEITGRRDFGQRLEHLAHSWRKKGKCKREHLETLSPPCLVIGGILVSEAVS